MFIGLYPCSIYSYGMGNGLMFSNEQTSHFVKIIWQKNTAEKAVKFRTGAFARHPDQRLRRSAVPLRL
ncbi:MAG: hypothetical protein RLO18_24075, partial [Gimesia chilikensis]